MPRDDDKTEGPEPPRMVVPELNAIEQDTVETPVPGKETQAFEQRLVNAQRKGLIDEDHDHEDSEVALARFQAIQAILTGPNGKWLILGTVTIAGLFLLIVGSAATGFGFHANPKTGEIYFGQPAVEKPIKDDVSPEP